MLRGCDVPIGNGINANGYALIRYNILRDTINTFPSAPVACNNKQPYRMFYYTFNYILIYTYNTYIYKYVKIISIF